MKSYRLRNFLLLQSEVFPCFASQVAMNIV